MTMQIETIHSNPTDAPPIDQSLAEAEPQNKAQPAFLGITGELAIYMALVALALILRLPQLGTIPLDNTESHEALTVFRLIQANAPGTAYLSRDPLMFSVNTLVMSIFGTDNVVPRISTVLVGALVVLLPILLRRWLGPTRALLMSGLLAFSPVLLTASRTMGGPVWTMALALITIWAVGSFVESRRPVYGIVATTSAGLLLAAAESAGFITALAMLLGLIFAVINGDDGGSDQGYRGRALQILREWPWTRGVLIAAISIALAVTTFFLHPTGFSNLGEALFQGVRGITMRLPDYPLFYPLYVSLVFEPGLWIFGIVGAYLVLRNGGNFLARFFLGWLLVSLVAGFLYAGAGPSHALWFTIPLAGLACVAVDRAITPVQERFFDVPSWGIWIHGLAMLAMLAVLGINVLMLSRMLLRATPTTGLFPSFPPDAHTAQWIMVVLVLILIAMTFMLVSSSWGSRTAWRGTGIGLLGFLLLTGINAGWRSSVELADDARDLWHPHAVASNLNLLQDSLRLLSQRQTGAAYDIPITAAVPDDGPVAWVLHNYLFTTFVPTSDSSLTTPLIITPRTDDTRPGFGAAYVGQSFPVHWSFDRSQLFYWDYLPLLTLHESRIPPKVDDHIVLWVRGDVYGISGAVSAPAPAGQAVPPGQPAPPNKNQ